MKDSADALVKWLRGVALEVLSEGDSLKASRYLAMAKELEDFFRYESFLSGK